MDAVVLPQVDPLGRARDPGEQRVRELLLVGDEGEDGAVMVRIGVDVEHVCTAREGLPDGGDHREIPPFRHVRDGLEQHRPTLCRASP